MGKRMRPLSQTSTRPAPAARWDKHSIPIADCDQPEDRKWDKRKIADDLSFHAAGRVDPGSGADDRLRSLAIGVVMTLLVGALRRAGELSMPPPAACRSCAFGIMHAITHVYGNVCLYM